MNCRALGGASARRRWTIVGGALLALAGCGGSDPVPVEGIRTRGVFVGQTSDSGAFVAIVAGTDTVVAAAVDATSRTADTFGAARRGDDLLLETPRGSRLTGSLGEAGGNGELVLGGVSTPFVVERASGPGGLYRAAGLAGGDPLWVLWIVRNDGRQRGAAGSGSGIVVPPPVDVASRSFTYGGTTAPIADVQPDAPPGPIDDAGATFAGSPGFNGGQLGFGGFSQFGGCTSFGSFQGGFAGSFCQFSGSFGGGFGGKGFGFGGGGFFPDVLSARPSVTERDRRPPAP